MSNTPSETANPDGHGSIRIGRFVSRAIDTVTYKIGRESRLFRQVLGTAPDGSILDVVCLVPQDYSANWHDNQNRLRRVMETLDAGYTAIKATKS